MGALRRPVRIMKIEHSHRIAQQAQRILPQKYLLLFSLNMQSFSSYSRFENVLRCNNTTQDV